jgi:alanine racemase
MAYIVLKKDNIFHNLRLIEQRVSNKNKIAVVLKDNAYGHGLVQIASLCKEYGIKKAVVRDHNEALIIKDYFETIICLTISKEFDSSFEYVINDLKDFNNIPANTKVHLKIDTGMHRNGIFFDDLELAFDKVVEKDINLQAVMTHFRSADELSSEFFWQSKEFEKVKQKSKELIKKLNLHEIYFHSKATHSIFRSDCSDDDMVRVGLGLYGYLDLPKVFKDFGLKPVLSLWANKISQRELCIGQKIGYGGAFICKEDMVVSNYDLGYADGFPRLNEYHDFFVSDEEKILGRVSMDNLSINSNKDKIEIFNNVNKLANITNTINYDILVKLKPNISKLIV